MAPPDPEPKLALTRSRILSEAIAVADAEGVAGLSMRKLAQRLGAGPMSLYTHVENKDDLLEGMVDLVVGDVEPPAPGEDWRRAIRASASSAHHVLLAHPWVAAEWTVRMPGPARLRLMDAILATLTAGGLDPGLVYRGYHAITMHVVGFTIQELGYASAASTTGTGDLADLARGFLDGGAADALPHLAEHVRAHIRSEGDGDEFVFVLDLILDGLDRANR